MSLKNKVQRLNGNGRFNNLLRYSLVPKNTPKGGVAGKLTNYNLPANDRTIAVHWS